MKAKKIRRYLLNSSRINKKEKKELFPILNKKNTNELKNINRSSSGIITTRKNDNDASNINLENKSFYNIKKNELNSVLYKLKNYYTNIIIITNNNNLKIEELKKVVKTKENKLEKLLDFRNFELPFEKISVRDFNELTGTKSEIKKIILDLMEKKNNMDYLLINENQYFQKLENMYDIEKNKAIEIKKEMNEVEFKLNNTEKNIKILDKNLKGYNDKNYGFNELNQNLQNNIDLAKKVISHQKEKSEKLERKINKKEDKMEYLEYQIKYLKRQNNSGFEEYKNSKYNDIQLAYEKEKDKKEKEKYFIDIIYCIYLIQKYFIKSKKFNKRDLESDKEYINLIKYNSENNNITDINDKDKNKSSLENNEEEDIINNNLNCIYDNSDKKSSLMNSNNKYKNEKKEENYKNIFNSINITKKQLLDYYSELTSKITFNIKRLNYLNEKEINLENKNDMLNKKVKKIIEEDFYFFEGLTKNNTYIKKYIEKNKSFINKLKHKNKNTNYEEINNNINNINELYEKENKNKLNDSDALYSITDNLILSNKNFFAIIIDILSDLISLIKQSLDNKIIKDSLKNALINRELSKSKTQRIIRTNVENKKSRKESTESKKNNNFILFKGEIYKFSNDYIKEFNLLQDKLLRFDNLLKKNSKNNDNLELYTQKLIDYCDNNKNIQNKLKYKNINTTFFEKNKKVINKSIQNKEISFNYFLNLSSKAIENIKSIVDFLKKYENNLNLFDELTKNKSSKILNNKIEDFSSFKRRKSIKSLKNSDKNEFQKKFKNNDINIDEYSSIKSDEYEKDESSFDTEMTQKEKKIKIKKVSSIGKTITNRLYRPFLEKTFYIRKLNRNMNDIKAQTLKFSRTIFAISKKKNEEKIISNQMMIYNNPNLKANNLSSYLYNDLNSLIINTKKINEVKRKEKRINSSLNIKQKLFKLNH